jgi:hypothetical protein
MFVRLLHMVCMPHFVLKPMITTNAPPPDAEGIRGGGERLMRHDEGLGRLLVDGFILAGPISPWSFEDVACLNEILTSYTLTPNQKLTLRGAMTNQLRLQAPLDCVKNDAYTAAPQSVVKTELSLHFAQRMRNYETKLRKEASDEERTKNAKRMG